MLLINTHADVFSQANDLKFGLNGHLYPYFVYASSEGSGELVHMRRLALGFADAIIIEFLYIGSFRDSRKSASPPINSPAHRLFNVSFCDLCWISIVNNCFI